MPNMQGDQFIDPAQVTRAAALLPSATGDYALNGTVAIAMINAALAGAFTCNVNISAWASALVQILIQRLVNLGYTATMTATVLTVNW